MTPLSTLLSSLYDYQGQVANIVYLRHFLLSHLANKIAVTLQHYTSKILSSFSDCKQEVIFCYCHFHKNKQPSFGNSIHRQATESGTLPALVLEDLACIPSCTYATQYKPYSLIGGSVSGDTQVFRSVDSVVLLWSSYPLWVPQSFMQILHKTAGTLSNVWGLVSTYTISFWSLQEDSYVRLRSMSMTEYH